MTVDTTTPRVSFFASTAIGLLMVCDVAAAQEVMLPRPRDRALPQAVPVAAPYPPTRGFDEIVTGAIDRHRPGEAPAGEAPPAEAYPVEAYSEAPYPEAYPEAPYPEAAYPQPYPEAPYPESYPEAVYPAAPYPAEAYPAAPHPAEVHPAERYPVTYPPAPVPERVLPGALPPAGAALQPARPADPAPASPQLPGAAAQPDPATFAAAANQPNGTPGPRRELRDPAVARIQVLLDRAAASPGVIDGLIGSNVAKAVWAFQTMHGLPADGRVTPELVAALESVGGPPAFVDYVITEADVAGPFVPNMPTDYAELAVLPALGWRNPAEKIAEDFHMDEGFLRWLNPGARFDVPGTVITVADPGKPIRTPVARLVADKARKQLLGYDAENRLVVAYPATIGSAALPSPTGIHAVKAIAVDPEYWYRPAVNFVQGNNTKAMRIAPGPNNPVGSVWIGLDKPTYGIHGTPEPSRIDKTNSHGCLRLTNWDAKELVRLVKPGVTVEFYDPNMTVATEAEPAAPMLPAPN